MGTTTATHKLWYPIPSDLVQPVTNDFPMMMGSVDEALTRVQNSAKDYATTTTQLSAGQLGRADLSQRSNAWLWKGVLSGHARVAVMGDSKAEGVGSTTEPKRWQGTLRSSLRKRLVNDAGDQGIGYVPATYAFDGPYGLTSVSGARDQDWQKSSEFGLGNRCTLLLTTVASVTYAAQRARYVTVHWSQQGKYTGSFEVWINDVRRDSFSCNGATSAAKKEYDLGSVQDVRVELRCTSSVACVEGVTFQTAKSGVTVYDAAHSGWRADLYEKQSQSTFDKLADINPHLVIVALGSNDMAGNWGTPIPAADWASSLNAVYSRIVAACPRAGVAVLHAPMRCEDARSATTNDRPSKLVEFEGAARSALLSREKASLWYEGSLFQPLNAVPKTPGFPSEQDPLGWLADAVHPSDLGHSLIAAHMTNLLTRNLPLSS